MTFITDDVIYASTYVEAYTGKYFFNVSTYKECQAACASEGIYISKGYRLSEIDKVPTDMNCILVQFSKESDYTEHDYLIMTIQKKYLSRFKKNLAAIYDTD